MRIFDLFRHGYEIGNLHGRSGERRRANWEVLAFQPIAWLPGTDTDSLLQGYQEGFKDGITVRHIMRRPD